MGRGLCLLSTKFFDTQCPRMGGAKGFLCLSQSYKAELCSLIC